MTFSKTVPLMRRGAGAGASALLKGARHVLPAPPHRGVPPLVPLGILAFLAFGGPGLVWLVAWAGAAVALTGVVLLLVLGAVASPFLLVVALVILALRRRRPRRFDWDPRWR